MSRKEVPRPGLVKAALANRITNQQGAVALHLSVRQFQRLKQRYRLGGARALVHQRRGQSSSRRLPPALRQHVAALLTTTYAGFNDCHATEKLREVEGLALSRPSVRRLRRALGLPAKHRRRPRQYRARRTPEAHRGALVQLDGSPFDWLEGRGPAMTLLGAIDDASSEVLTLHFRPTEDLHGYTTLLSEMGTTVGLPLALYGDRLNVFIRNDRHWTIEEELQGAQHPTHFGRMLQDLGIGFIAAGSPQAKGRIERLWRTLQDRLVSELRLRGIATREAANAYLPAFLADFNRRFAHVPTDATALWRRPPRDLARVLSCRYTRVVAPDNTLRLGPRWLPLPRGPQGRSSAGCRVELRELLDGRLLAISQGRVLAAQPSPGAAFVLTPRGAPSAMRRRARPARAIVQRPQAPAGPPRARRRACPAPTHPWRKPFPLSRRARALIETRQG